MNQRRSTELDFNCTQWKDHKLEWEGKENDPSLIESRRKQIFLIGEIFQLWLRYITALTTTNPSSLLTSSKLDKAKLWTSSIHKHLNFDFNVDIQILIYRSCDWAWTLLTHPTVNFTILVCVCSLALQKIGNQGHPRGIRSIGHKKQICALKRLFTFSTREKNRKEEKHWWRLILCFSHKWGLLDPFSVQVHIGLNGPGFCGCVCL